MSSKLTYLHGMSIILIKSLKISEIFVFEPKSDKNFECN